MSRHVILVGLPGSGKTTVGRLVAERLGARFADLDEEIEARMGKSIARIFADDGEAAFRALEAELGEALLAGPPQVIAPGGGYVMDPVRRRQALAEGLVVYLATTPRVAAERLSGSRPRPLLGGADPALGLAELLGQRRPAYLEAHQTVTTDGLTPEQVADRVVRLARTGAGW